MALVRITIDTGVQTANSFKSVCDLAPLKLPAIQNFENYIGSLSGGLQSATMFFHVGAVRATGTFTFSSTGPTNTQTCSVANVTFTAVTSGATGNQFNISATPSVVAANFAAAINASASLTGRVSAVALAGVVTLTVTAPGAVGNGVALSAGTLSNTVVAQFSGGSDGTNYTITP